VYLDTELQKPVVGETAGHGTLVIRELEIEMESNQGRVLVVSCSSYLSAEAIVRGMDIVVIMDIFSILTLEKYSCEKSSLMIRV